MSDKKDNKPPKITSIGTKNMADFASSGTDTPKPIMEVKAVHRQALRPFVIKLENE